MDELNPEVEKRMIPKIEGLDELIAWLEGYLDEHDRFVDQRDRVTGELTESAVTVGNLIRIWRVLGKVQEAQS